MTGDTHTQGPWGPGTASGCDPRVGTGTLAPCSYKVLLVLPQVSSLGTQGPWSAHPTCRTGETEAEWEL